ncbi:MAG TPA: hypothetical protein DIU15_08770 [Deltaproteobacteria bacterium]|nr:hypothetical protein [Deltaproteobacteria bacterium]HCP46120.1 hypothetical protein [Deltaproteobacteria bacterium]
MAGCLWVPGYPPDKDVPDIDNEDSPGTSHCSPHAAPNRPNLLKSVETPREFNCRIRLADSVTWMFSVTEGPDANPITLATGVERLFLHRSSLPWSPQPYEGNLELRVQAGGVLQVTTWPLIVLPHSEELFIAPDFDEPIDSNGVDLP